MEFPSGYHVAAEIPEHLIVAAFVGAVREEGGVPREERFWEEEEGCCA